MKMKMKLRVVSLASRVPKRRNQTEDAPNPVEVMTRCYDTPMQF